MSDLADDQPSKLGAVVVGGVGEGLGFAVATRFAAAGYSVVMLARSPDRLRGFVRSIEESGGTAEGRPVDLRDEARVTGLFGEVAAQYGRIDAAIYNAGAQHHKPLLEISGEMFEKVWRLACFGAFVFGREAIRHMLPFRRGTVMFTGATASLRGGAGFAAFAAGKFGTRAIAQSMAREFGPQGIHVASIVVDGGIDMPEIRRRYAAAGRTVSRDGLLAPSAIAETYFQIHRQHRSAWTMETELRPYREKF
jgi:NAD(P)-dependent dehydrogenase (short-subunit alcohol dehydrogenase family)